MKSASALPPGHADGNFLDIVHAQITDESFARLSQDPDVLRANAATLKFLANVQRLADDIDVGGKTEGRMYLHNLKPRGGYAAVCRQAAEAELGIVDPERSTTDVLLDLSKKRAVDWIAERIQDNQGQFDSHEAGQIWYVIGQFLHAVQDGKHRSGNVFRRRGAVIPWPEHFTIEAHQTITDVWPTKPIREKAIVDSVAFLRDFSLAIFVAVGNDALTRAAFQNLASLSPNPREALAYQPDVPTFNALFPDYPIGRGKKALF